MTHFVLSLALLLFQAPLASIEGVVTNDSNGERLSKAVVELRRADADNSAPIVVTTSTDGAFAFRNIQPGRFKVIVARAGYVQMEYRSIITVASGQPVTNLRIALTPTGTIYGRVTAHSGQPLANVKVKAMKVSYAGGHRSLKTEQTAVTNDLGEYRLFWLAPGSYFVSAMPSSSEHPSELLTTGVDPGTRSGLGIGSFGVSGIEGVRISTLARPILNKPLGAPGPNEAYVPTYFPGSTDDHQATMITVRPGSNMGGVDITIAPVETHHIRGVIVNGITRQPAPGAQLRRARASALDICATVVINEENCSYEIIDFDKGTFDIAGVTPGSYVLYAVANDLVAQASVDVRDADADNVVLTLRPGIAIAGKISPPTAGVTIRLNPGPPLPDRTLAASSLRDGAFSIGGVTPGDYTIAVSGLKGVYVQSIASGNVDVLDRGLHVTGPSDSPLQIVLGTNPATIEGRALNAQGAPIPGATVVLVPAMNAAQTDEIGRYQLKDVAPGDYKLFAWETVEADAWADPDFMKEFEGQGTSVHVGEGNTLHADAQVISSRR